MTKHSFRTIFFIISCCLSCSIGESRLDPHQFEPVWLRFIAEKEIATHQFESPEALQKAFDHLDSFNTQQLKRQRPFVKGMDRFEEYVPYQENQLTLKDGTPLSASTIILDREPYHHFIACQAPLKSSVAHFWQMVWENKIDQIVMTTELQEEEELCYPYWPLHVGEKLNLGNGLEVALVKERWLVPEHKENIQVRTFTLKSKNRVHSVTHYWYHNWMDNSAPQDPLPLLTLIKAVQHDKAQLQTQVPILAHCAAGVGRTGVFITLYHMLQRLEKKDQKMPLFELVARMRWQRSEMVGEFEQYRFCFTVCTDSAQLIGPSLSPQRAR